MAGRFTNTQYNQSINNIVSSIDSRLNNPYYKFNDKKPTIVTYYRQNKEMSTLDEASGLNYAHVGEQSPFKFNKINQFILYGIEQIQLSIDIGDYGAEADAISGTFYVLPNTIEPLDGDFFLINHIKEKGLLFKVNKVTPDTLDTGANIYQADYQLELTNSLEQIEKQVVKTYNFIANNVGTDFKCLLSDSELSLVNEFEILVEELIKYYTALFFDDKLQTFVFSYNGTKMYDPYMIQFLINNKILDFGEEYIYVSHATALDILFPIQYSKTIFYQIENKSLNIDFDDVVTADIINDPNSLFVTRMEPYYQIRYRDPTICKTRFHFVNKDLLDGIRLKEYTNNDLYNFIISYFKDEIKEYIGNIFEKLKFMDIAPNTDCFYCIPIIIYILQNYINSLIK